MNLPASEQIDQTVHRIVTIALDPEEWHKYRISVVDDEATIIDRAHREVIEAIDRVKILEEVYARVEQLVEDTRTKADEIDETMADLQRKPSSNDRLRHIGTMHGRYVALLDIAEKLESILGE